ncbi:hypothetical protein [Ruegeria pomeroyi]|uniref:hypothetical protein n=1 Tax=Ruegeria pomeroyi TaxID=89184 RepID=UPI001F37DA0B|nr:hypothetical protein [Ruegeria pomeroyi]
MKLLEDYYSLPDDTQTVIISAANDPAYMRGVSVLRVHFPGASERDLLDLINYLRR